MGLVVVVWTISRHALGIDDHVGAVQNGPAINVLTRTAGPHANCQRLCQSRTHDRTQPTIGRAASK